MILLPPLIPPILAHPYSNRLSLLIMDLAAHSNYMLSPYPPRVLALRRLGAPPLHDDRGSAHTLTVTLRPV